MRREMLPFAVGRSRGGHRRSSGPTYQRPIGQVEGSLKPLMMDVGPESGRGDFSRQIVFGYNDEPEVRWLAPEQLDSEAHLRELLEKAGHLGRTPVTWVAPIGDSFGDWVGRIYPRVRFTVSDVGGPGQTIPVGLAWAIGDRELQAVATLAFHLFLAVTSARGDEDAFTEIRAVVRGESPPSALVQLHQGGQSGAPLYTVVDPVPGRNKHMLVLGPSRSGQLIADLVLFHDREGFSPWWRVLLSSRISPHAPTLTAALVYFEDAPRVRSGTTFHGELFNVAPSDGRLEILSAVDM